MEYGDEVWGGVDSVRRPFRDEYRDAFFRNFGGERLQDPFTVVFDICEQFQIVMGLIDKANEFHEGEDSALQLLRQTVSDLGFGTAETTNEATDASLPFNMTRLTTLFEFFAG